MPNHYPFHISWSGDTLDADYARSANLSKDKALTIAASSAPEYKGDTTRWNPEDLMGSALGLCHMLTFLALANKSRIQIKHYEDHAVALLDAQDKGFAITEIHLKPTITVAAGTDHVKTRELFEKAHKYCFIAASIKSKVVMEPTLIEG